MTAITARPRRWSWPADRQAPGKARKVSARALARWGLQRLSDDAVLMISELVANGALHGGSPLTLTLRPIEGGICGEVGDGNPRMPIRAPEPTHGLGIVTELADSVWVRRRRFRGKVVGFELRSP